MGGLQNGSFRLFRLAGITVFLHWSWLFVAVLEIQARSGKYSSPAWNTAEYLALFAIVLLHEFGHALACRSVGGSAEQIVLWPLGGVAFVSPPPRPGAVLWSIVAGPLVNVVLLPITTGLYFAASQAGWDQTAPDLLRFVEAVMFTNGVLLVFNLLPIYPLDGGQILQSLLWFVMGRSRSLTVVSVIGIVAGFGLVAVSVRFQAWWFAVLAAFIAWRSWTGFQQARFLAELDAAPRHKGSGCPSCGTPPLKGDFWSCDRCRTSFDIFDHAGECPGCGQRFEATRCPECLKRSPIEQWLPVALPARAPERDVV